MQNLEYYKTLYSFIIDLSMHLCEVVNRHIR